MIKQLIVSGTQFLAHHLANHGRRSDIDKNKAGDECWTLFFTGLRIREWGYITPTGWVHWKDKGNVLPPKPYNGSN